MYNNIEKKKSNKKIIIPIIIISVVAIIIATVFIVISMTTDFFKSDEEQFQTFFIQNIETINNVVDLSSEAEYRKILEQQNYDENTQFDFKFQNNQGEEESYEGTITGTDDNSNNKAYKDLKITSGDIDIIEIEYLQEQEIHGLHFVNIADQYATIDFSNDISGILEYFKLDQILNTEKINIVQISDFFEFTEEEKIQLENNLLSIILQGINKNNYASQADTTITLSDNQSITTNAYTLTLTPEQVSTIYLNILNYINQDQIILGKIENIDNKVKEMGINLNKDIKTLFSEKIQELTNNIQIQNELIITVFEANGQTLRTAIQYGTKVIESDINNGNNIIIRIADESSEQIKNLSITKEENTTNINYEDNLNTSLELVRTLNNTTNPIQSITNIKFTKENTVDGLELNINRNIQTGTNTEITTSYAQVGKILLNDYDNEALDNEISINYAISTLNNRIIRSVREKRDQTDSTLLNYIIEYYNQKEEEQNLEEENQRKLFNSKFEMYEGQNLDIGIVLNMLDEAGKNMTDYKVEGTDRIILNIQEGVENEELVEEIKNALNSEETEADSYNIELSYDENGLINRITVILQKEEQTP